MTQTQPETVSFVTKVRRFQPFDGSNHKMMQRLLTGRDPTGKLVDVSRDLVSPKRLEQLRLGYVGSEADKAEFRSIYVDTSLAVLPGSNSDEVTFFHKPPLIYKLNEDTKLDDRNLKFDGDVYAEAKKNGFTIRASNAKTLKNNPYGLPTLRREFFEYAFEGDIGLTNEAVADVEKITGLKFRDVMGIYLPKTKGLRLLSVGSVNVNRSNANGNNNLDSNLGRLVGVALEAKKNKINPNEDFLEASVGRMF